MWPAPRSAAAEWYGALPETGTRLRSVVTGELAHTTRLALKRSPSVRTFDNGELSAFAHDDATWHATLLVVYARGPHHPERLLRVRRVAWPAGAASPPRHARPNGTDWRVARARLREELDESSGRDAY